jgi:BirA family biotin operon repressor/biotin-[acetyl-CoA-carboxylase] ligase
MAITTASQTHGRGTNKRTWIGKRGNVFLTVAVPSDDIHVPVSLLPLQIGVILAQNINDILYNTTHPAKITLKWPNDVLINDKKVAGVLIESEKDYDGNYYFLIGIGINYKFAPKVQSIGPERGRVATCICDYLEEKDVKDEITNHTGSDASEDGVEESKALGIKVAKDIQEWMELQKIWDGAAEDVVTKWENWAEFGQKLMLRDTTMDNETVVIPLRVEKDGRLRVKGQDGRERLLCFDYLF